MKSVVFCSGEKKKKKKMKKNPKNKRIYENKFTVEKSLIFIIIIIIIMHHENKIFSEQFNHYQIHTNKKPLALKALLNSQSGTSLTSVLRKPGSNLQREA